MQSISRSLKVGALIIAALVASVVTWRTLFQQQSTKGSYVVHALFRDATGLVPRSRVQTAGIAIGEIESIRLEGTMARVDVRINDSIHLHQNATIAKRAVSVLGEFLLVVSPGNATTPELHSGERINTVLEGSSTDEIMNNVAVITERVRLVTERVADAFGSSNTSDDLRSTLHNIASLSAEVNRAVQANTEVLTHTIQNVDRVTTTSGPEIQATLVNLRESTERLSQILGRGQPRDDNTVASAQQAVRNIAVATRDLREAMQHINNTTGVVDRGEGTVGRLLHDETLIDEVQGAARSVTDLVGPIARLQTIVGLRSEYQFISNTLRSYVEVRLQPREDKYYLLEIVDDPRGATSVSSEITDTTDPMRTPHVRTVRRTTTDAFRFTIMFARRFGPTTFRFGIKESTGGFGVDFHLLDDALEIRSDLFNFGGDIAPRLRVTAAYEILQRAWLVAGVDDVFNPDRFDYFLGAQLRFNDEDLKSILPFAGGLSAGR
jgi:phospholipid/cholesterol/gamma-HCH transport system substrate-binding protein